MNFDKEKARGLMVIITGPLLLLNSIVYCVDIVFDLKVLRVGIELIAEQIFLVNYFIVFITKPKKTIGLATILYITILSILILVNEDAVPNLFILKIIALVSLLGLVPLIFVEFKRCLRIILAKD